MGDQILEVELAAPALQLLVTPVQPVGERQRGQRLFKDPVAGEPVADLEDVPGGGHYRLGNLRRFVAQALEHQRALRLRHAGLGQKRLFEKTEASNRVIRAKGCGQRFGKLPGATAAIGPRDRDQRRETVLAKARQWPCLSGQRLRRGVGVKPVGLPQCLFEPPACTLQEWPDRMAVAHDFAEQLFKPAVIGDIQHGLERPRQVRVLSARRRRQQAEAGVGQKRGGGGIVQHREMAGDIGLQRKPVQQAFAEGVDGLDLQPARRFQRMGEQAPRHRDLQRIGPRTLDLSDLVGKGCFRQHRPFGKPAEHPVRHFGRRRLRIGEAEDRRGSGAGQQQPDHALGQHMGLARAGIGRDPDGTGRIGGEPLASGGPGQPGFGIGIMSRLKAGRGFALNRHRRPPRHRPSTIRQPGPDDHTRRKNRARWPAPAARRTAARRISAPRRNG